MIIYIYFLQSKGGKPSNLIKRKLYKGGTMGKRTRANSTSSPQNTKVFKPQPRTIEFDPIAETQQHKTQHPSPISKPQGKKRG